MIRASRATTDSGRTFSGAARVAAAVLACAASACGSDDGGPSSGAPPNEDTRPCEASSIAEGSFDLPFEGTAFKYTVHVPPGYDGTKRTPLVLNWHGLTSNATQQVAFSGMNPVADESGFIVVYPDSPTSSWNAGTCCGTPARNDVAFARALVAEISAKACIDSKRIYSTGMSNGGFMSHRLACEASDLFAAVAPVAGKVGIPDCSPPRPVPVMHFHGTEDTLVAYATPALSGEQLDVPGTIRRWGERNGCDPEPAVTYQQGTVTCDTYSHCKDGADATLCTAVGEGHCWPGTAFCPFGAFTTDIDASRQAAAFFARFKLP
jgi:polyhydroxybutyrate depolymerase